ncbi:putative membrane spanning protein [Histomonas meleagridis]|uniref:putative membrane spanning protein n=1 Tax=Histomonas meleagridis TaxID=135588 RepID=UPI00355A3505|nr:putative membrane spanning protein [Histomonas meleagridis]KAH0801981.1 putative membrane spanning protein [Histomonas meleagridis]
MGFLAEILLAAAMLASGSLNTIAKKIMYQTKGKNIDGELEYYSKPWLCTFVMFCGESMCMVIFYLFALYYKCTKPTDGGTVSSISEIAPESNEAKIVFVSREEVNSDPTGGLRWKFPFCVTLFALCDLLSTTLTGIGLVYCNASVVQILRGFVIVFTMINGRIFLKRIPTLHHILGVVFAIVGLAIVGTSAVLSDKSSSGHSIKDTFLGIGLVIVAQIFSSIQFVFEEKLLKQNTSKTGPIPSLFLVGSEGIAGAILSIAVALPVTNAIPGNDHGSYENMKNSFYMMFHNPLITGLQFLYFVSIAFFNWFSFVYSKALSATARTLVDACRTILVWIVMVIVFYSVPSRIYGEGVSLYSILQCFGFVLMMLGTTTHNNIANFGVKITSCCKKPEDNVNQQPLLITTDEKEGNK